jgi:hypothetical protein
MTDESPIQIPPEAIVSEEAIAIGVDALERIHGHHLAEMTPEEQAEARAHWRRQVEETLTAVRGLYEPPPPAGSGRAVIWFTDGAANRVHITASFQPELQEMDADQLAGTPAQVIALRALQLARAEDRPEENDDAT